MIYRMMPDQCPAPPLGSKDWADWLRWIVSVADHDSGELRWAARLLPIALSSSLTERQHEVARSVARRVFASYRREELAVQRWSPELYGPTDNVVPLDGSRPRG
jgi:hypothetical protein